MLRSSLFKSAVIGVSCYSSCDLLDNTYRLGLFEAFALRESVLTKRIYFLDDFLAIPYLDIILP